MVKRSEAKLDPAARARRTRVEYPPAGEQLEPKAVPSLALWPVNEQGVEEKLIDAPEVVPVVKRALEYHSDLVNVKIRCLFVQKAMNRGGRSIAARVSKFSVEMACLSGIDATLKVAWMVWKDLNQKDRLALIDTELCRLHRKLDSGALENVSPCEVYPEALNRHGAWNDTLRKIESAVLQKRIPFAGGAEFAVPAGDRE